MTHTIIKRTRFFLAVEGEGEQSFIKWVQELSDQTGLHVYMDCQPLSGGGYKTMLDRTLRYRQRRERYKSKASILLVDGDRAGRDDGWSLTKLREEARNNKIMACIQSPNQEGLLLRMLPGNERLQPADAAIALRQLRNAWPEYQKPIDARMLAQKYTLADLMRVANYDPDLRILLETIGLYR